MGVWRMDVWLVGVVSVWPVGVWPVGVRPVRVVAMEQAKATVEQLACVSRLQQRLHVFR